MNIPQDLIDGDICLYRTSGLVGELVSWKEGDYANVDHVAIYVFGRLFSSLTKDGICFYPFTAENLVRVRRPAGFDVERFNAWAQTVIGSPYGWADIRADAGIPDVPHFGVPDASIIRQTGADCSDTCAMALEVAGWPLFDPMFDKRRITPFHFMLTIGSKALWNGSIRA